MSITVGGYFWACTDCTMMHANDEANGDRANSEPEPWALWTGEEIAMGGEHADGCTNRDGTEECDCETIEFTWSQCEGCGSYLGGSRYAFVWFVSSDDNAKG